MTIDIQPVICGMIQENAYIVSTEGRDDCIVIDPGDDFPKLKRALGGRRVGAILLTHGHFDHLMAAGELAEACSAAVYADPRDMEMLNNPVLNGYDVLMGSMQTDWRQLDIPFRADMDPDDPDRTNWKRIDAEPLGDAFEACGMAFDVLRTPGHSRGSVCLYLKGDGILFSGDTLFREGYGRLDLYGGNVNALIGSLRRLFALPEDTRVYPGHGDATTIGEERARYRL